MIRVYGIPKPQPRPRAFVRNIGGKMRPRVHEAGTAEAWKSAIADAFGRGAKLEGSGPIQFDVVFLMPRPKRLAKKSPYRIPCDNGADCDNLIKSTWDALTSI